jgi:hypothetical protein
MRPPYNPGPELRAAVTAALSTDWQTVREIASKTKNWLKPSVRKTLLILCDNGFAEGEQRYLPPEGRPANGYVWVFRKKKEKEARDDG